MIDLDATIVAIATPPGRGGVGCVRLSGTEAAAIASRIFRPSPRSTGTAAPRFGRFLGRDGRAVDHGYLVLFPADASFTGEPTAELWPHGSPAVLAELVETAIVAGAKPAGPGEFTYRALRHGRLDLARAEAVRDLVEARTLYQARTALAQAEGALSRRVLPLRETLVDLIARAEAAVEFVDEAGTHLAAGAFAAGIRDVRARCGVLLAGFRAGRLVREGATVVLAGLPNVGKSSLFNRLLERERAIVAALPGTTRDTLEEGLDLDGVPVRLVDTAGVREGRDPVEDEGIRRARNASEEADLVVLVLDASRPLDPEERRLIAHLDRDSPGARTLVVENKTDLTPQSPGPPTMPDVLRVSAKTGEGVADLRSRIRERLMGAGPLEDPIVTNARHARALEEAAVALDRAAGALGSGFTEEVVLEDLREAVDRIGEITGAFTTEDLFDRIFSTFCIGK